MKILTTFTIHTINTEAKVIARDLKLDVTIEQ